MDFHNLKRKDLQALCKKHNLCGKRSNFEMANDLTSLLKKPELEVKPLENLNGSDEIKKTKRVRFCIEGEDEQGRRKSLRNQKVEEMGISEDLKVEKKRTTRKSAEVEISPLSSVEKMKTRRGRKTTESGDVNEEIHIEVPRTRSLRGRVIQLNVEDGGHEKKSSGSRNAKRKVCEEKKVEAEVAEVKIPPLSSDENMKSRRGKKTIEGGDGHMNEEMHIEVPRTRLLRGRVICLNVDDGGHEEKTNGAVNAKRKVSEETKVEAEVAEVGIPPVCVEKVKTRRGRKITETGEGNSRTNVNEDIHIEVPRTRSLRGRVIHLNVDDGGHEEKTNGAINAKRKVSEEKKAEAEVRDVSVLSKNTRQTRSRKKASEEEAGMESLSCGDAVIGTQHVKENPKIAAKPEDNAPSRSNRNASMVQTRGGRKTTESVDGHSTTNMNEEIHIEVPKTRSLRSRVVCLNVDDGVLEERTSGARNAKRNVSKEKKIEAEVRDVSGLSKSTKQTRSSKKASEKEAGMGRCDDAAIGTQHVKEKRKTVAKPEDNAPRRSSRNTSKSECLLKEKVSGSEMMHVDEEFKSNVEPGKAPKKSRTAANHKSVASTNVMAEKPLRRFRQRLINGKQIASSSVTEGNEEDGEKKSRTSAKRKSVATSNVMAEKPLRRCRQKLTNGKQVASSSVAGGNEEDGEKTKPRKQEGSGKAKFGVLAPKSYSELEEIPRRSTRTRCETNALDSRLEVSPVPNIVVDGKESLLKDDDEAAILKKEVVASKGNDGTQPQAKMLSGKGRRQKSVTKPAELKSDTQVEVGVSKSCLSYIKDNDEAIPDTEANNLVMQGYEESGMHVIATLGSTCPAVSSADQEVQAMVDVPIVVTESSCKVIENASLIEEAGNTISNASASTATNTLTCIDEIDNTHSGISSFKDNGKDIGVQEVQAGLVTDVVPTVVETCDIAQETRHIVTGVAIPDEEASQVSGDSHLGSSVGLNPESNIDATDEPVKLLENPENESQKVDVGENSFTFLDLRYQEKEERVDEQVTGIESGANHAKGLAETSVIDEFSDTHYSSAIEQSGECSSQAKLSMEHTSNKTPLCDSTRELNDVSALNCTKSDVKCTELCAAAETKEILVFAFEYPQKTSSKKSTLPPSVSGKQDESVEPQLSVNFDPLDVMVKGQENLVVESGEMRPQLCKSSGTNHAKRLVESSIRDVFSETQYTSAIEQSGEHSQAKSSIEPVPNKSPLCDSTRELSDALFLNSTKSDVRCTELIVAADTRKTLFSAFEDPQETSSKKSAFPYASGVQDDGVEHQLCKNFNPEDVDAESSMVMGQENLVEENAVVGLQHCKSYTLKPILNVSSEVDKNKEVVEALEENSGEEHREDAMSQESQEAQDLLTLNQTSEYHCDSGISLSKGNADRDGKNNKEVADDNVQDYKDNENAADNGGNVVEDETLSASAHSRADIKSNVEGEENIGLLIRNADLKKEAVSETYGSFSVDLNEDIVISDDVLVKTSDCEVGKDMAVDEYVEASPLLQTCSPGGENDEDEFAISCKTGDIENNAVNLAEGEDVECLQQVQEELGDQEKDVPTATHGSGPSVVEENSFKENDGNVEEGTDAESAQQALVEHLNVESQEMLGGEIHKQTFKLDGCLNGEDVESYRLGDEHDENLETSMLSTRCPIYPELENDVAVHMHRLFRVESDEKIKGEAVNSDSESGKLVAFEEKAGTPPDSPSNFFPTNEAAATFEETCGFSILKDSGSDPSSSNGYVDGDAGSSDSKSAETVVEEKENAASTTVSQSYRLHSEDVATRGDDSEFVVNGVSVEKIRDLNEDAVSTGSKAYRLNSDEDVAIRKDDFEFVVNGVSVEKIKDLDEDVVSSDSKGAENVVEEKENAGSSPHSQSYRLNSDEDAATSKEESDFVANDDLVEKTRDEDSFEDKLDEHAYMERGVGAKPDCENFKDAVNQGAKKWALPHASFVELVEREVLKEKMTEVDANVARSPDATSEYTCLCAREDVEEESRTVLLSEKSAEKFDQCDDRKEVALILFEKSLERDSIHNTEVPIVHNVMSIDKDEPDALLEPGNKEDNEGNKTEGADSEMNVDIVYDVEDEVALKGSHLFVNEEAKELASLQLSFVELDDHQDLEENITEVDAARLQELTSEYTDVCVREDIEKEDTLFSFKKSTERFDGHGSEVTGLTSMASEILLDQVEDIIHGFSLQVPREFCNEQNHSVFEFENTINCDESSLGKIIYQSCEVEEEHDMLKESDPGTATGSLAGCSDVPSNNVVPCQGNERATCNFAVSGETVRNEETGSMQTKISGEILEVKDRTETIIEEIVEVRKLEPYNGNADASISPFVQVCNDGNLIVNMTDELQESMELSSKRLSFVKEVEAISTPKNDSRKDIMDEINGKFSRIYISSARKGRQFSYSIRRTPTRLSRRLQPDQLGSGMKENVQTMKTEPLASRMVEKSVTRRRPLEDLQNNSTLI